VAGDSKSRDDVFEDERFRLKDGLKSCRNVVANYRSMLEGESSTDDLIDLPPDDEVDACGTK
jgi:hypothetical protein